MKLTIGENIKSLRHEKDLTQEELAIIPALENDLEKLSQARKLIGIAYDFLSIIGSLS